MDAKKYPADWKAISLRIRKREGDCCKWCSVKNGAVGAWHPIHGQWWSDLRWVNTTATTHGIDACGDELPPWWPKKFCKIVLTVAHLGVERDWCPQCQVTCREPGECPTCGHALVAVAGDKHDKMDVRDENLAALCQRCHLNFDRDEHLVNAAKTREGKRQRRQPLLPGINNEKDTCKQ